MYVCTCVRVCMNVCMCVYVCVCVCQNYQRKYCGKVQMTTARNMLCSVKCKREVRSERSEEERLGEARNRACDALHCTLLYPISTLAILPCCCTTVHLSIYLSICFCASVVQRIYTTLRYTILYYVCAVLPDLCLLMFGIN